MCITFTEGYSLSMNFVIKTPVNFVELSIMRDFESFGVPRPEMINTIFCFEGSQFSSHLGNKTAIRGKNVASMTHPGFPMLFWISSNIER